MTILAHGDWKTNAELIQDCASLGYLHEDWYTLDPTYGHGTFWKQWRPHTLVATDIDRDKSLWGGSTDFTNLPWYDNLFDAVVFDPPYKLNGTPDVAVDQRYGVHTPTNWRDRMQLILDGAAECARVLKPGGYLLVKCQDQVCSGQVRWQTDSVTNWLAQDGLRKVDRFDFPTYRPQPKGRRQVHAARNTSQLLVFRKAAS